MKAAVLLAGLLLAGTANEFVAATIGRLKMDVPAGWNRTQRKGTTRFAVPSGEAYFEVDVGTVQHSGGLEPSECLQKIQRGIGGDDWQPLVLGAAPAAVKVDVDADPKGAEFVTRTYVGCNGKTTWSLQFHWVGAKRRQFEPVADRVVAGILYLH